MLPAGAGRAVGGLAASQGVWCSLSALQGSEAALCEALLLSRKDHGWGKAQAPWTICHP